MSRVINISNEFKSENPLYKFEQIIFNIQREMQLEQLLREHEKNLKILQLGEDFQKERELQKVINIIKFELDEIDKKFEIMKNT